MAILNYTTRIPAARTLAEIQQLLADKGATEISVLYAERRPVGLHFWITTPVGDRAFRLPANREGVRKVLAKAVKQGQTGHVGANKAVADDHVEAVAWRILKDWIEAQLAIVEVGMASFSEVMFPYMLTGPKGQTVYAAFEGHSLSLALPSGE